MNKVKVNIMPKLIDLSFTGCLFNKHNIETILKNVKPKYQYRCDNYTIDNYELDNIIIKITKPLPISNPPK